MFQRASDRNIIWTRGVHNLDLVGGYLLSKRMVSHVGRNLQDTDCKLSLKIDYDIENI